MRPAASSKEVSERMARVARRDTGPEVALRRELHRLGLRYRVDCPPISGLRTRADVVIRPSLLAVFVDGCFWHGCSDHGVRPKANRDWWRQKLDANISRDRRVDAALREAGWEVIRVWE